MERWIDFSDEKLLDMKEFVLGLYGLDVFSYKYFDKLVSIRREYDDSMTIDRFLSAMDSESLVYSRLIIGREERRPDFSKYEAITYFQRGVKVDGIERFFWYFTPLENYNAVDKIAYDLFGKRLSEFKEL